MSGHIISSASNNPILYIYVTAKGNCGYSASSQRAAQKQAEDMDALGNVDCKGCTNCRDCDSCSYCDSCEDCVSCSFCLACSCCVRCSDIGAVRNVADCSSMEDVADYHIRTAM